MFIFVLWRLLALFYLLRAFTFFVQIPVSRQMQPANRQWTETAGPTLLQTKVEILYIYNNKYMRDTLRLYQTIPVSRAILSIAE